MKTSVVLNIGWARAASTAFRQNFLNLHPEILASGRGQLYSEGPSAIILQHIKGADDAEFQHYVPELRAEWQAYEQEHRQRVICVSDEELSIGVRDRGIPPTTIAARCGMVFQRARTLAIVRDQADAIRSFYTLAQRQGREDQHSFAGWVDRYFLEPTDGRGFSYLFAYMSTLRAYLRWQPRQDILVVPYDLLRMNHAAVYADVACWLGVSVSACESLPNNMVNASQTARMDVLETWGRRGSVAPQARGPYEYSPGQEARISALFEQDNKGLAREFGIEFSPSVSAHRDRTRDGRACDAL
jgi:hypothetical protein